MAFADKNLIATELRLRNLPGEYRHVLLYAIPIFGDDDIIEEWIGTITDIHDRKIAEEALIAQKKEVENAYEKAEISNTKLKNVNQVLETFVYAAAHDLKSPIINLKSLLQFIHQTPELDKKFELIHRFEEAVIRLDNTISGLGEIVEVQEADNSIVKPIYFQDISDQVQAEYEYKIIESSATITTHFESCPSIVYLESYLNSVITNMVTNALKYYKEGIPLMLDISSKRVGDSVVLTFSDNGIGMDLNRYGSNLFKPFKRFTNKAEGKGIGLHIIKTMIEKNGGKIEVESAPGEGTRFICTLKEYEMPD